MKKRLDVNTNVLAMNAPTRTKNVGVMGNFTEDEIKSLVDEMINKDFNLEVDVCQTKILTEQAIRNFIDLYNLNFLFLDIDIPIDDLKFQEARFLGDIADISGCKIAAIDRATFY